MRKGSDTDLVPWPPAPHRPGVCQAAGRELCWGGPAPGLILSCGEAEAGAGTQDPECSRTGSTRTCWSLQRLRAHVESTHTYAHLAFVRSAKLPSFPLHGNACYIFFYSLVRTCSAATGDPHGDCLLDSGEELTFHLAQGFLAPLSPHLRPEAPSLGMGGPQPSPLLGGCLTGPQWEVWA